MAAKPVYELFRIPWYHIFFNPFFIIRGLLHRHLQKLAPQLQGRLLDFGCGTKPYRHLFTHVSEYIGVDYEGGGNPYTKQHVDVYYDGRTLPFADASFDALLTTETLEHIFNPEEIVAEWFRVLKPGARLLLTCPFAWPEHEQPWDYARYSSFGIRALLERHGFRVLQSEKTGNTWLTIGQLWVMYLYYLIPKWPVISQVLYLLICLPFQLLTLIGLLLPGRLGRRELYLNNVVLAEKPAA